MHLFISEYPSEMGFPILSACTRQLRLLWLTKLAKGGQEFKALR